jgi:hypothetical protein
MAIPYIPGIDNRTGALLHPLADTIARGIVSILNIRHGIGRRGRTLDLHDLAVDIP